MYASNAARMSVLFARYINGQITEKVWQRFTDLIDSIETGLSDREALVDFFLDALDDIGLDAIKLPPRKEAEELVAAIRVAG